MAWKCSACGYVHRGPNPPDFCPVCGASRDEFEPYVEAPPAKAAVAQWLCENCQYIHTGPEPPGKCPVCGAPAGRFEPCDAKIPAGTSRAGKIRVAIIGGGIGAVSAAESLRQSAPDAEITIFSKEPDLPYYRLNLTRYLAGEVTKDALPIHPQAWYDGQRIEVRTSAEAAEIAPAAQTLRLADGETVPFDRLIVAAGSHPFVPPIPGASREGVMTHRTVRDTDRILAMAKPGSRCVCVGGGLLGLETAGALAKQGCDVTVVEGFGWLLPRQLNQEAGVKLATFLGALKIRLQLAAKTEEFVGDERVRGVRLADGTMLDSDLVVVTAGVRPNSYLARVAGLEVNQGVIVDGHLRTSHPGIFAVGDVSEHRSTVYGTWSPSQYQGSIAGMNAAGLSIEFGGIPRSNTLKVLGIDVFSIGIVVPEDASYDVLTLDKDGEYYRFVFRDSHLAGAILLGNASLAATAKQAVENKIDFSGVLSKGSDANSIMDCLAGMKS